MKITDFEKFEDEKIFWIAYSRNHCMADIGALYAYCFEIVNEYFNLETLESIMRRIGKIMNEFGRAMQINGDLSDFIKPNEEISTLEKRPQKDCPINIRTDRLTYPTWLLLTKSKRKRPELFQEIQRVARERAHGNEFYQRVHGYLKESGVVTEVLGFVRKERNRLRHEIDKLGIENEGTELWKTATAILTDNKFVRQLKADYELNS